MRYKVLQVYRILCLHAFCYIYTNVYFDLVMAILLMNYGFFVHHFKEFKGTELLNKPKFSHPYIFETFDISNLAIASLI